MNSNPNNARVALAFMIGTQIVCAVALVSLAFSVLHGPLSVFLLLVGILAGIISVCSLVVALCGGNDG